MKIIEIRPILQKDTAIYYTSHVRCAYMIILFKFMKNSQRELIEI